MVHLARDKKRKDQHNQAGEYALFHPGMDRNMRIDEHDK
jgi:hypothetical protein